MSGRASECVVSESGALCERGCFSGSWEVGVGGSVTYLLLYWNTRCSSAMLLTSECFGVERDYYHRSSTYRVVSCDEVDSIPGCYCSSSSRVPEWEK